MYCTLYRILNLVVDSDGAHYFVMHALVELPIWGGIANLVREIY